MFGIIFEVKNCFYCDHFHRALAPVYGQSKHARSAPLHYADVRQTDMNALRLKTPITVAPTAVLMHDGKELARIQGVTSPDACVILVGQMINTNH